MTAGIVYLVGGGPGDPGLLTIRGAEILRRADVIVYDRLVHPSLLNRARPDAERIYAGKESLSHTLTQEAINALIVERAQHGKTVCRLKGGDPFVFGRGGEEAEACRAAGVAFEVIPGVTSAIAAPAYAGIPVTHRELASSFAVITGHEDPDKPGSRIRWKELAHGPDTLIFLMGVENLPDIVCNLIQAGRPPDTPIALIRWGTWPQQETLVSTLGEVVAKVKESGFKAPAVTVVGEVVNLREPLRWFDTKPLFGKRILVTRAREQASALSDLLREHGAEPVEFPVIRIKPLDDYSALDSTLTALWKRVANYSWVVFTSVNGVRAVQERLRMANQDARAFAGCKLAAIGPATAGALAKRGLRADFVPSRFVAEAVAEEWPDRHMSGQGVLIPRAKEARDVLPQKLREMGAQVDVIPVYETVVDAADAESLREQLRNGEIDIVTFTSSSTVKNFVESIGADLIPAIRPNITVASIGPITSQTARDLGLNPDIEATEHTIPGLVDAILNLPKDAFRPAVVESRLEDREDGSHGSRS